jgi:hypothetical protein
MAKKPRLTLISPEQTTAVTLLAPPSNLGKAGHTLWQSIMGEYDIRDSGGQQICEAADRVQEFSVIIKRDGPVIRTKMGRKITPY